MTVESFGETSADHVITSAYETHFKKLNFTSEQCQKPMSIKNYKHLLKYKGI